MNILAFYINKKNKLFKNIIIIFILSILTYFIVFSKSNFQIVSDIVVIFIKVIIPSLFPFILLSNILIFSGYFNLITSSYAIGVVKKIFKLSSYGSSAVVFGLLFGYPNGAIYVNQLYEEKKITHNEAEYLLLFINNSSPAFILSSIGIGMFSNMRIGAILLLSHILSSILVGKIFSYKYGKYKEIAKNENDDISYHFSFETLYKSITKSLSTLGIIFGFMVIFVILHAYITKLLNYILPLNLTVKYTLLCIMEISNGLKSFLTLNFSLKLSLIAISFFLGFSSFSIIFQIYSSVYNNNFNLKNILKGKFLQGIFSAFITYILINIPKVYEYINIPTNVNLNIDNSCNGIQLFKTHFSLIFIIFTLQIILIYAGSKKGTIKH